MARYAPGLVPTSNLPDTQRWLREEFELVRGSTDDIYSLAQFLLDNYVIAGYGSIGQDVVQPYAIGATWQDFNLWDVELLSITRGVTPNLPNGFIVQTTGLWQLNIKISLSFNDLNAGRSLQLRFFNATDGLPGGSTFNYWIGRNTDGVNIQLSAIFEIDTAAATGPVQIQADKDIRIQIRSDDTFTNVQAEGSIWDWHHISEYRGDFFNTIESPRKRRRAE